MSPKAGALPFVCAQPCLSDFADWRALLDALTEPSAYLLPPAHKQKVRMHCLVDYICKAISQMAIQFLGI